MRYLLRNTSITFFNGKPVEAGWVELDNTAGLEEFLKDGQLTPEDRVPVAEPVTSEGGDPGPLEETHKDPDFFGQPTFDQPAEGTHPAVTEFDPLNPHPIFAEGGFLPLTDPAINAEALSAIIEVPQDDPATDQEAHSPDAEPSTDPVAPIAAPETPHKRVLSQETKDKIAASNAATRARKLAEVQAQEKSNG